MSLTDDFREVMSTWVSGVTVVTSRHDELVYGITVSSFSSLSLDPLLIVVCIANSNRLAQMVQDSGSFGVNILSADQESISRAFATAGREPLPEFDGIPTRSFMTGAPLIEGAVGQLDCELYAALPGGDHTIAVGKVVHAAHNTGLRPLVHFRRQYHTLPTA